MQRKDTPRSNLTLHRKPSTHSLGQVFANGKAQTCSMNLSKRGLWTSIEGFKNALQFRAMNADSAVLYADGDFLPIFRRLQAGSDANASIDTGVVNGVSHQILQAPANCKQITEHARQAWRHDFLDNAGFLNDQARQVLANALQNLRDMKRAYVVTIFSAADRGEEQDAVHILHQLAALTHHDRTIIGEVGFVVNDSVFDIFGRREDGSQGCSQLVGDRGDEIHLRSVKLLRPNTGHRKKRHR